MKNTLTKSSLKQSNTRNDLASIKVLVFEMGNLKFALRIETAYKVLNQTPIYGTGLNGVGIANIGDREVTIVDLHRRLFQCSITNNSSKASYLIVTQNQEGELYGIPIAVVPALIAVPLSSIQVLPESYRNADLLGFASHFCHIPQEKEAPLTIFLLDVDQLLQAS